ncbi:hypothetical protein D9M69_367850 [compost metagenome]
MQHDAVEPVVQRRGARRHADRRGQHAVDFGMHVDIAGGLGRGRRRGGQGAIEQRQQRCRAVALDRHGADHRHAQRGSQLVAVDPDAAARGGVAHVEHHHHRQAQPAQFQHEAQVQAQVGRIHHRHQQVGALFAGAHAQADVARDGFIQAGRVQAVGTRQVQDAHLASGRRDEMAFLALDGHAGVVGHLLPAAGQSVEQCGLAAIGIAYQRDAQGRSRGGCCRHIPEGLRRTAWSARSVWTPWRRPVRPLRRTRCWSPRRWQARRRCAPLPRGAAQSA